MIIAWNDGHPLSGIGTGAAGIIKETDRNRRIGVLAKKYLLEYENVTIIDCTIDYSSNDMYEAVMKANNANADLFVSNHVNSGGGVGFESFYSRKSTQSNINRANIIHKHLVNTKSCLANRRCCDDYSYKGYDLYVLINTKMEAILCEIGFVDNQECVNTVNDDEVARAYASGIAEAYGLKKKQGSSSQNNNKEEEILMQEYIVQYSNDTDKAVAEHIADRLYCPTINCAARPFKYYSHYKTVIAVGVAENKSGYTNVEIKGSNRAETMDKAIAWLKSIGR